jgi:hypothetical protein
VRQLHFVRCHSFDCQLHGHENLLLADFVGSAFHLLRGFHTCVGTQVALSCATDFVSFHLQSTIGSEWQTRSFGASRLLKTCQTPAGPLHAWVVVLDSAGRLADMAFCGGLHKHGGP